MSAIEHLLIFTQRYELGKCYLKTLQPLYKVSKQTKTVLAQRPDHRLSSISPNLKGFFQQGVALARARCNPAPRQTPCCRRIERSISSKGYPRTPRKRKRTFEPGRLPRRHAKVRTGTPCKRKRTFDPAQPLMTRTAAILPCPPSPAPHSEIADRDLFPQHDMRVYSHT